MSVTHNDTGHRTPHTLMELTSRNGAFGAGAGPHGWPASVHGLRALLWPQQLSSVICSLQTQGPKLGVIQCMLLNEGELGEGD